MAEEVIYDQVETGGDPDPLGLRKKLAGTKSDPLGLRAKLPIESKQQTKEPSLQFKPMTDWLNIPQGYQPMVAENAIAIDDHTKNTAQAADRVNEHLQNIDQSVHNLIYSHKNELTGRIKSEDLGINPSESGPINQQAAALEGKLRQAIPVKPEEIEEYKNEMPKNPVMLRQGLAQKVKDLTKTDEIQANTLKGDIYRLDRQGSPEKEDVITKNIEKLKTGEYDYDVVNGRLIKREGFFASVVRGAKDKGKAYDDYDVYKSGDEKKILDRINQRLTQDPDKATPMPEGVAGEAGMMLGGQPLKPLIAGGVAGYFSGGTAAAAATAAVSAPEMYKLTFGSALPHNYDAIKKQNPNLSDKEVLQQAIDLTNKQANADALSGAAMGAIGARAALKPSTSLLLQKSVKSALKQVGEIVAIEGLGGGAIGATGQLVKNIMAQKAGIPIDESEGMAQQLVGGVMMTLGMSLAAKSGSLLKPSTYNKLLHGLSKIPEETLVQEVNKAQQLGAITPEEAQKVQTEVAKQKEIDGSIRGDVPESERLKIQEKIKQRDAKEKELEIAHKAYHPEIKEEIKKLDEDILALSKGSDRGELQSIVDKAKIEGPAKTYLRDLSEKDLKEAFKEISSQAHDPFSENQAIVTYGEEIVNKAKELYPKEEPKESKISVIQPSEIKHPETITIKPKEDAISIENTDTMDVRQQAGYGEPLGEGNQQPEIAAGKEISGQETSNVAGQEGIGQPPIPTSTSVIHAERSSTQLSFRGLQETANEFGYDDVVSRTRVSDIQEKKNAEITANEWAERGEYQRNIDDLLNKVESKELVPTAKQRLILEQYLANEKQKLRELPRNSEEFNSQLEKVRRIKEVGQIARQEAGAALRLPQGGSQPHPINDLVDAMVAKMEANSVDKLTEQQKAEVEAQVETHKNATDQANVKVAKLEGQVAKLEAEKEFKKAKSTTKREKKTATERIAYRRSEIEAAREALKKLRTGESGLSAVPLPGVRELMAIAPHVKNIMVDLVAQGVDNLQDVVSHLHNEFKDVLDGITEKNIHDIIAGEYNEKKKPLSELQRQIGDIRDEAKYINQLESLLNGKEPKNEKAKIERNVKIKALKDKIKAFKQEEIESNKFYGESDVAERKLDKLRDELDRIENRRLKEKPEQGTNAEKEISKREQEIKDQIKEAQSEWDNEKESAKQAKRDYLKMETERNRQLNRVSDLKEKLENLQKGIKNKGTKSINVDTPEIESLKEQVKEAEKHLNKTIATEKRINKLEEELERLTDRRDKEPKETEKREISDREKELKEKIKEERKAFNEEQKEQDTYYKEEIDEDAKKLMAIKKRNEIRAQEIKNKISKGQFEKEVKTSIFDREDVKKNYPNLRKEALDALAKKEEAQHEFDLALFNDEMAKRSKFAKAADFAGKLVHTSKALMAGIDDSASFVQNGLAMLANPKLGAKVWLQHWKEAFNEARFKRELAAIHARPDYEIIKNSGLDIVEPHTAASKQVEEAFEQNLLSGKIKIKGEEYQPWKYTGGIFERAFTSMGNNFRLNLFDKRMDMLKAEGKTWESHPQEYKDAARAINELTGRGKLPLGLAQASPYITPFIWAPRLLTSTVNTLGISDLVLGVKGKGYYQNLTPTQRKFALGQLGRGVAMGVAVMVAASYAGAKVDYDPRSVTFGDIIAGDHHYNVFGRYVPVIKALVQVAGGTRLREGKEQDLDNPKYGGKTRMGVVGGFFRGKMTPAAGAVYDLGEGKNYFTQQPFGVSDLPAALLTPLSVKELKEGWENDGTWTLLNRFLPAFEGIKTSDERDFNKSSGGNGGGGGATTSTKVKPIRPEKPKRTHK